ncbi:MAG TPA: hypothetical protein PK593_06100 [Thermomicrobiales bacterium]|jgi:uncharacterized small protein (DUF1192 family)|nr:hypothetical protein [Chloroflexota bacterium]HBY45181.1 hypothetical protein [Chloroflexota bacterium]HQX63015.1 hypothetical protein [Thermomicrobiales bacterium]HQZ90992.1 hypothetical protein [Thermomicrobiales bacterium]HRA31252.1 hypothetical protein [Thermomicrobiales bacterium]
MSRNDSIYDKMVLLDRLEELREDMSELDVHSLSDLDQRIASLEEDLASESDDEFDDGSL